MMGNIILTAEVLVKKMKKALWLNSSCRSMYVWTIKGQ